MSKPKEFEVVSRDYKWFKYTREYAYPKSWSKWRHLKSYATMEAANDALRDLRRSGVNKREYSISRTIFEAIKEGFHYPAYVRFITIRRYKAQRKDYPPATLPLTHTP